MAGYKWISPGAVRSEAHLRLGSRKTSFKGRVFDIETVELNAPDGRKFVRHVVVHGGASAMIPLMPNGRILLVKQFRLPAGRMLWEIPAGTLDKGESPMACARRELVEETGHRAAKVTKIAEFFSAPGFCTERLFLFLCEGLKKVKPLELDDDEDIEVREFKLSDAMKMISGGEISDSKTIVGLLLLERLAAARCRMDR
jgi:ADP-ribose pyrophosphatase